MRLFEGNAENFERNSGDREILCGRGLGAAPSNLSAQGILCGIDEAGRGCLAGHLAIAGVVLTGAIEGLNDSKKLSPQKRAELAEKIKQNSLWHIALFDAAAIDEKGLSGCLAAGLRSILAAIKADRYLYDGNCAFGVGGIETQIKADASVAAVSAASILAKTAKDSALLELAKKYPEYGFEKHQGYGVKAHLEAIARYGLSEIHRKSFKIKSVQIDLFGQSR